MRERVSKFTGNAAARKRTSSRTSLPSREPAMKLQIYFYNPLTWLRPCEQAKPLREHMKRLRDFSRALFASFSSASRNSPAMRRRASALPAAFRSHPRESAMKPRTYLYNSLTRHRPTKILQPPRKRCFPAVLRSHLREPAMKPRTYLYNSLTRHRPAKGLQSPRDRSLSSRTSLPSPRASDETRNLFLQFINVALPMRTSQTAARTHEAPA